MQIKYVSFIFLLSILLIGCSGKNTENEKVEDTSTSVQQVEDQEVVEKEELVDEVEDKLNIEPYKVRDAEALMKLEPGIYGENHYDETKVKEEIATFSTNLSEDDYFASLLALVADDYRTLYEDIANFDTSFAAPDDEPEGNSPETGIAMDKEVNVAILLDASGSMRGEVGGKSKMEHAVNAIESFVSMLPSEVNVSLQVYGHKGTSDQKDKSISCASTEVVYPLSPYNQERFSEVLNGISPAGWTPLGASIAAAYEDLQSNSAEGMENIIYIVSDGVETCDGNPAEEAEKLNSSNIKAVVNIIGFDVDDAGQNELKAVAEAGKGKYMTVTSQQEMEEFFTSEQRKLEKEWLQWQSENVSSYHKTELEKRKQIHGLKNDIYDKANNEMEKLLTLTEYMRDTLSLDDDMKRKIDKVIRNRNYDIRNYAREKEQQYLKEIQEKARESREEVREKGEQEREKIKSN